ncbi:hypothetical protein [Nostoc sp. C117]|uniref:hypothetical protein n=1 Tax=Nostoc sp. C117 TaxID=3349875 RepID=UPI00370D4E72
MPVFVVAACTHCNSWDYEVMTLIIEIPSFENWCRKTQLLHRNHTAKICCMILPSKESIRQIAVKSLKLVSVAAPSLWSHSIVSAISPYFQWGASFQ